MTVDDLIKLLEKVPRDAKVYLPFHEEATGIISDEENNEVEIRPD